MYKKIIAILLAVLMIVSLGACAKDKEMPLTDGNVDKPSKPVSENEEWIPQQAYAALETDVASADQFIFQVPYKMHSSDQENFGVIYAGDNKRTIFCFAQNEPNRELKELPTLFTSESEKIYKVLSKYYDWTTIDTSVTINTAEEVAVGENTMVKYIGHIGVPEDIKASFNVCGYAILLPSDAYVLWFMVEVSESETISADGLRIMQKVAESFELKQNE